MQNLIEIKTTTTWETWEHEVWPYQKAYIYAIRKAVDNFEWEHHCVKIVANKVHLVQ